MQLTRPDVQADLQSLRSSRSAPHRAIADNFDFEERVSDARRDDFETADPAISSVVMLLARHFDLKVQGARHDHIPVTFTDVNRDALYLPDVEPNQKVVRLECLDDVLRKTGRTYEALNEATSPGRRDDDVIVQILDQWRLYPGARPAFVAFKSEVEGDLAAADWVLRLRNRMGLGHYDPAPGQQQTFALMEYLVKDVISAWQPLEVRGAKRPFALPTVLDSRQNPCFFPSPRDLPSSFAVDLGDPVRAPIREMLHVRINYLTKHLIKVGQLIGPLTPFRLANARDGHLDQMRRSSGRGDFGAPMSGDVDS